MVANYRSRVNFPRLVEDCWGILQGVRAPFYRGTGRGRPATIVFVSPTNFDCGWHWNLWETLVGPTLVTLQGITPVYPGGWGSPQARLLVDAYLRKAFASSPTWSTHVDYDS